MPKLRELDIRLALIAEVALVIAAFINIRQLLGHGTSPATVIPVVCILLAAILMSLAIIRVRLSKAEQKSDGSSGGATKGGKDKLEWQSRQRTRPREDHDTRA